MDICSFRSITVRAVMNTPIQFAFLRTTIFNLGAAGRNEAIIN